MIRAVLLSLVVILGACGVSPVRAADNCTVELNGDSVLFGFATTPSWRLPTTPAGWLRMHGYTVTDNTAGGLTMRDLVNGYNTPFAGAWSELFPNGPQHAFVNEDHPSRIVVLQTGLNDARLGYPPAELAYHYRTLIDFIRAQGRIPVITGITQVDPSKVDYQTRLRLDEARRTVRQVANERAVHYASFDTVPLAWTDGWHLNQASSNGIAENLRYVLGVICGRP